jgi:hypothetical protein
MQFREQGRKVQVIRNTYVPELGPQSTEGGRNI